VLQAPTKGLLGKIGKNPPVGKKIPREMEKSEEWKKNFPPQKWGAQLENKGVSQIPKRDLGGQFPPLLTQGKF